MMMSPNIPFLDINYNNHVHGKQNQIANIRFFTKGMDSTIQNNEKKHSRSQDMHCLTDIWYEKVVKYAQMAQRLIFVVLV